MKRPTGIRRVVSDIADLCELQMELLAVDGKVAVRRIVAAGAVALVATVCGLSAVVTVTLAVAFAIYENAEWTMSVSLLVASGLTAALGSAFALASFLVAKKALAAFEESRAEFVENLRWIKAAIVQSDAQPAADSSNTNGQTTAPTRDFVR